MLGACLTPRRRKTLIIGSVLLMTACVVAVVLGIALTGPASKKDTELFTPNMNGNDGGVVILQNTTKPSPFPTTATPTNTQSRRPVSSLPSLFPTSSPTEKSSSGPTVSVEPSIFPSTASPSLTPSFAPTLAPTKAPTLTPTPVPTSSPTASSNPTGSSSPTVSPTALPSVSPPPVTPTAVPTARPTVPPPPVAPTADLPLNVIYTGNGPPRNRLSLCQGDCDRDSDCQSGLKCFQRNVKVPVPGCRGGNTDTSLSDYCVSDGSPPAPTSQPVAAPVDNGDIFRLKLYWEQGYYWQESTREAKWCMRCRHNNCSSGNKLYLHECKEQSVEFSFIGDGDEKLIQVQNGKNLCLERRNNDIFLKSCNSSKNVQLWFARDGSFNDDRFKLSQKTYNSRCVTQRHHPKHDEEVEIEDCEGARRDETVYWNKWDP